MKLSGTFWDINVGHLGTIAVVLVGVGMSWGSLSGRINQLDQRDAMQHAVVLDKIQAGDAALDGRVVAVEKKQGTQEELARSVEALKVEIANLRETLREYREDLRRTPAGR